MHRPHRRPALLLAALVLSACAYESSGTTTTTAAVETAEDPPTSPASLAFPDQRIEGSAVTIESVLLPAAGFIVLQEDVAGAPGDLIGMSEVIGPGRIENVSVAFFVPLDGDAIVHGTVHVDIDRDRNFLYEPPDSFVDVPASGEDGSVATAAAMVELLPPLSPTQLSAAEARIDGTRLQVESVTLPAPGFVAVQRNEAGQPGELLGATPLLPEGTSADLIIELDPPLRATGLVWVVPYVDRDEDGVLSIDGGDDVGETGDGSTATVSPVMTVVPLDPAQVSVSDQEGDGSFIVVSSATFPSPGFLEVLRDVGGVPGDRIARSELVVDPTAADVQITLDRALDADTSVWVLVRIDFDQDRELTSADPQGLTEDGDPALARFTYTFVDPDADADDGDGDDDAGGS